MKDSILSEEIVFDDFIKVVKATVQYDSYSGDGQIMVERLSLERGNAVAVLLYERDTDSFLFTEQYRYPAKRRNQPWCLELPAGEIDNGENAQQAGKREVLEEIGYDVKKLEIVTTYFPSPGVSSEQITIVYGEVTSKDQVSLAGGKADENEDIKLVKIKRLDALKKLKNNEFNNSISLIGLQWFFMNKDQ